jgi:hypothetical protein
LEFEKIGTKTEIRGVGMGEADVSKLIHFGARDWPLPYFGRTLQTDEASKSPAAEEDFRCHVRQRRMLTGILPTVADNVKLI